MSFILDAMRSLLGSFIAAIACSCTLTMAQTDPGDVVLTLEDGVIRTNVAVPELHPQRVFTAVLGEASPNFTDEPGFDSEIGTFPTPGTLSLNMRGALHAWDGRDFDAISTSSILLELGPLSRLSPTTDQRVEGFPLQVASNGQWHRHFSFTLQDPASPGIYLLELDITSSSPGIAPTLPFFIVFAQEASEDDTRAAAAWARWHLANECPADLDDGTGAGFGDGGVNIADLLYFLARFEAGDAAADLDDGSGAGLPDAGVNIDDLVFMLRRFEEGC